VNSVRFWILTFGVVSFLVGLSAGLLSAGMMRAPAPAEGPFADYQQHLVAEFGLDPERQRALHEILRHYRGEIESVRNLHTADFMSSMEPGLRQVGVKYRKLIRDHVLPDRERARFDRLCATYWDAASLSE